MPKNWDVIVVGGGIWGLSCAYACAKRGQSVAIYEAGKIGQGASCGLVGAMAPHAPESWNDKKQFQFEALDSAEKYWNELDQFSGLSSGYGRVGRIMPITSKRDFDLGLERIENTKSLWRGQYNWNVLSDHPMIPKASAPFGVVYDTLSARIYPARAVASLAKACTKIGVEIYENRCVTGLDDNKVIGTWGEHSAAAIILAGGTDGFSLLDYHLGCTTGVGVKGQAALLDYDLGNAPQIYANGVYVIPHLGGVTAVGSTTEKNWEMPYENDERLDALIERAGLVCPALCKAPVLQRWAGLRPKARRRHPMLGPIPGLSGVFSAMGAYTIGFGIVHSVGSVLADFAGGGSFDLPKNFTVSWHLE